MPYRYLKFFPNNFYHVFNRGFKKQTIFFDHADYDKFYKIILKYLDDEFLKLKIESYCFLPNHFHFIMIFEKGNEYFISNFMRKIQQSYAQCLKSKYGFGKGPVFEGRFKAKVIQDDKYLQQCFMYVNFNAVKHKIVDNINDWKYTSYHMLSIEQKEKTRKIDNSIGLLDDLEI